MTLTSHGRRHGWALNVAELRRIDAYFASQGREPTRAEMETLAQTWSEHCGHKTMRGEVRLENVSKDGARTGRVRVYRDLLKETVFRATRELNLPWCWSVFKDNAGVVALDDRWGIAVKVETHNHPSALEPYGGASTGLGGVIRDILGCGLGAEPIAGTDVFCVGPPEDFRSRRILTGVVEGVRDYGNRMGIPTISGAVCFHPRFRRIPLVFCGCLGLLPRWAVEKKVRPGDILMVAGGRTGLDGLGGATFSSASLTEGVSQGTLNGVRSSGVVQIGHPVVEKKLADVMVVARDRRLYRCVTDCGAGGLSSAIGEMAASLGARVRLDAVKLKYSPMEGWQIWLSESQERMVFGVPPACAGAWEDLFRAYGVEAARVGEVLDSGRLQVFYQQEKIVDLALSFLHAGCPKRRLRARATAEKEPSLELLSVPLPKKSRRIRRTLLEVLSSPDVSSKEWILRQYDHEVQGRTVLKPFSGPTGGAPQDASVLRPLPEKFFGVAVAQGIRPRCAVKDAYAMAAGALEEAVRNLHCVGGRLRRVALLDNFCAGDPEVPEILGELTRASQACYDGARGLGYPFISGKDSLHNTARVKGKDLSIPTVLLVTAVGILSDIRKLVSMEFKRAGNWLYLLGMTLQELGSSQGEGVLGKDCGRVPAVRWKDSRRILQALREAQNHDLLRACHDLSDGGLGVAIAEMVLGSGKGAHLDLGKVPRMGIYREYEDFVILFSESHSRFLVEVSPRDAAGLEDLWRGVPFRRVGRVQEEPVLEVKGTTGIPLVRVGLPELGRAWRRSEGANK
ncbi:MAG: phosphoribosylformylglycinamidine synthase subunit PurL [Elusimicrobia bacterium]|nr:phosphoribosylformylglycinamidine synthase subunit PurL [Elusimicrobiota bacterium]